MERRKVISLEDLIDARCALLGVLDELEDQMLGHVVLTEVQKGNERSGPVWKTSDILDNFIKEREKSK